MRDTAYSEINKILYECNGTKITNVCVWNTNILQRLRAIYRPTPCITVLGIARCIAAIETIRRIDKSPVTAIMPQGSLNRDDSRRINVGDMTQIYSTRDSFASGEDGGRRRWNLREFARTEKQMQTAFVCGRRAVSSPEVAECYRYRSHRTGIPCSAPPGGYS